MKYFSYGSNMSLSRIHARIPNAKRIGLFFLSQHALKYHKHSQDGSSKCDAFYTGNSNDNVIGALYDIKDEDKKVLDKIEGLGLGYEIKTVAVSDDVGQLIEAFTYYATDIDAKLKPYDWYVNHVEIGAREVKISQQYIDKFISVSTKSDLDETRSKLEYAVHN